MDNDNTDLRNEMKTAVITLVGKVYKLGVHSSDLRVQEDRLVQTRKEATEALDKLFNLIDNL